MHIFPKQAEKRISTLQSSVQQSNTADLSKVCNSLVCAMYHWSSYLINLLYKLNIRGIKLTSLYNKCEFFFNMFAAIMVYWTCLFDVKKPTISLVVFILSLQQMEDVQSQLDSEKKKSKDLASQIVKLNGIIKTGQDAIHQEQELVTKLKQQLEEREKVKRVREGG